MKKVIITGASRGLGYKIGSQMVKRGIDVINLSRSPSNLSVTNITTDLTKDADITKAIGIINKEHQDADVLILNSGILHWHAVGEIPVDVVNDEFAVNITGAIKLTNGIMSILKKNDGDVVVIGSTSSFKYFPGGLVYTTTKHALLGFIKSLQAEFAKDDVRIIGFHPGGFKSQLHIQAGSDIRSEDLMDPEYLATLLIYLLELPRNMEVSEIIINRKNPRTTDGH